MPAGPHRHTADGPASWPAGSGWRSKPSPGPVSPTRPAPTSRLHRRFGRRPALAVVGVVVLVGAFPLSTAGSLLATISPAGAYPLPGRTLLVSLAADGGEADRSSGEPAISADGRVVAFTSFATNLVEGDTNGHVDVFVRDLSTGLTERVSVSTEGAQGTADSYEPALSADGRFVAFTSLAPNLVSDDPGGGVFVHDRATGTTTRVSVSLSGPNPLASHPAISADGRFVAFDSGSGDLVTGDTNNLSDVFVRDLVAKTTERVSVASDGAEGPTTSEDPSISADGRFVAFTSANPNFDHEDRNSIVNDVFVHDRSTGKTRIASLATDGTSGNGSCFSAALSGNGRYVAFWGDVTNFVPNDSGTGLQMYVRDLVTEVTEKVSVGTHGEEGDGWAWATPAISFDGRYVAFRSGSANLVPDDTNSLFDMFVRDRLLGATERVSVASDGVESDGDSYGIALSADGRRAAFASAGSLGHQLDQVASNVFVRDRGPGIGVGGLSASPADGAVSVSGWARLAGAVLISSRDLYLGGVVRAIGAELTQARLAYRPEGGDLLVWLEVPVIPGVRAPGVAGLGRYRSVGGLPTILYGLEFSSGGVRYEVRSLRVAAAAVPPAAPYFGLYRCDPSCVESATLSGGFATTGNEIVFSIPLSAIGASEGETLTGLRAFTATGEAATGSIRQWDEVVMGNATIPVSSVALGLAPSGTPEAQVAFSAPAALSSGAFSGTIETTDRGPGNYDLWARACLGSSCGATTVSVSLS